MEIGAVIKWGLVAVGVVLALKFISGFMDSFESNNVTENTYKGPPANGVVFMYPVGVYPARNGGAPTRYGRDHWRGQERR